MNTGKTALVERFKNILLVVLVLSTILLLYFLWNDDAGVAFRVPSADVEAIPVRAVLYPERIVVNFGAENYTVPEDAATLWYGAEGSDAPAFMRGLASFLASDNIAVGAISEADFLDVMRARSIRADFSFAIPMAEFCTEFDLPRPAPLNVIEAFSCAAYSEASPESLFLCDASSDRYHRLAVEGEAGFKELIASIEALGNASYYPLKTFSGVENDTMLPLDLSADKSPTELPYARGIDPSDESDGERMSEMTRAFFGKRFDFTRKITEGDGTVVYMYGYGEKVLVINRDGSFEYSATESERSGAASFFDALTTALAFAASHSEPDARDATPKRIYLKDAQSAFADGERTYRFSFGLEIDGHTVYYAESEPLIVEVTGLRVRYYKRDMIDGLSRGTAWEGSAPKAAYAPFDLLTEHFAYIYGTLAARGLIADPEAASDEERMFERVAEAVTGLSSGLLRPSEERFENRDAQDAFADERRLLPVWVLSAAGVDFYFDLYTGAPAGDME
ncbi:MAG: hypothetical protein LBD95_03010 [Clostridiales Family XIII bacterium]|jgi:hypothetical protein|nr:hypothetical protein [Clostridiales Family XIII bacterium]